MKIKNALFFLLFLILVSILAFFAYSSWREYKFVKQNAGELSEFEIAQNKKRIHDTLIKIPGLDERKILQGFWYIYTDEYGNEHVLYFDPEYLAKKGLTDEELQTLYDKLIKSKTEEPKNMRVLANTELPPDLQFHNKVYSFGTARKTEDMLADLERKVASSTYLQEDLFELAYLYELEGRYKDRDLIYKKSCNEFNVKCQSEMVQSTVRGKVIDSNGKAVKSAKVEVLSEYGIKPVYTDADGEYIVNVPIRKLQKVRLHITKDKYSDAMADFLVITEKKQNYTVDTVTLNKADVVVDVDTVAKTATGDVFSVNDDSFIIKTTESTWDIPFNAIVHKNSKKYNGKLKVYVYEWLGESAPLSFLRIDTFGKGTGFVSDGMRSFGMPYIQFVAENGEELYVSSANPMELTYKMQIFSDEYRKTADRPLTDTDIQLLLSASDKAGYPITYELLQNLGMVYVPPFWALDRVRGVWDNVGFKLLNKEGLIKTQFYTMKALK